MRILLFSFIFCAVASASLLLLQLPNNGTAWGGFCNDSIVGATTLGANFYDISNIAGGSGAVTVVSGKISQITDACTPGVGDTLTQGTAGKRFTYNATGFASAYPAATESSASDFMAFASGINYSAYTVVFVGSATFVTWNLFNVTATGGGGSTANFILGSLGSNFQVSDNQTPVQTVATWTSTATNNSPVMISVVLGPGCSGGLVYLNNAVSEGSPTCTGSTLQLAGMTLSDVGKTGFPSIVVWAELEIFPLTLTSSQVSRLYTHFSSAFGGAF